MALRCVLSGGYSVPITLYTHQPQFSVVAAQINQDGISLTFCIYTCQTLLHFGHWHCHLRDAYPG